MTRLEKLYVRDEHCRFAENRPSSNTLINAVVDIINDKQKTTDRRLLVGGFERIGMMKVEEFVKLKNDLHELQQSVITLIGISPMSVAYLINLFFKKAGVLGVAYLGAALWAPHDEVKDDLVYEAEISFPNWEFIAINFIKLVGYLPDHGRKFAVVKPDGNVWSRLKVNDFDVRNISTHIYWGGQSWTYSGKPMK